jgi:hypothetical protein
MTGRADDRQLDFFGRLLQLARRVRTARSLDEASFIAVNETKQLFPYRQAVLWLKGRGVTAISGLPLPERNSPYLNWLSALFPALPESKAPCPLGTDRIPPRLAEEWDEWLPAAALLLPLTAPDETEIGFLLLAREESWEEHDLPLAAELCSIFGQGLAFHLRARPWRDRLRRVSARWHVRVLPVVLLAAALFWPVHITVLAPAEVTAKDPFLVRAPQDGVIDSFLVRPNEPVKSGQLLFRLDKTNVRAKVGAARKAYEVAAEEYRQASVLALSDDRGKTEMVPRRGKMEERSVDYSFSNQLLHRLEAKAPRDGIAIFSDQNDWVGKGVTIGEKVLLIADPAKAELLIRLPVADAIALEPGTRVTFYLATDPQHPRDAVLRSASYRSELAPSGVVAYRLKADFSGSALPPRIGLSGTARVYGKKASLAYSLFRRPLTSLRQRLGW